MTALARDRTATIVIFTTVVEIGPALVLLINPELVITWLLGTAADVTAQVVGQCFGIALLALAVAWWPDRSAEGARSSLRGALTYNALTALFLAYLGTARHIGGVLLWPAVALHVVVSFLLITTWRAQHRKKPAASTSAKISG